MKSVLGQLAVDERDATALREQLLQMARDRDMPVQVFIMAMADCMGITAAMLDGPATDTFEDRISVVVDRARERYHVTRAARFRPTV